MILRLLLNSYYNDELNMIRKSTVKTTDLIYSLSGDDKELAYTVLFLYKEIFNEISQSSIINDSNNLFLSYVDMKNFFKKNDLQIKYFPDTLKILCNPDVHVLRLKYLFIDEFDHRVDITADDVQQAYDHGSLENPLTGDLITNFKKYVFPFFVPNKPLKEMKVDLCQE